MSVSDRLLLVFVLLLFVGVTVFIVVTGLNRQPGEFRVYVSVQSDDFDLGEITKCLPDNSRIVATVVISLEPAREYEVIGSQVQKVDLEFFVRGLSKNPDVVEVYSLYDGALYEMSSKATIPWDITIDVEGLTKFEFEGYPVIRFDGYDSSGRVCFSIPEPVKDLGPVSRL